ncbi:unnamed protein product [marine sediment metagenome]|uniref:Twin-arginine translocation signal domain-containing protein n=1 Tax=marine sediment metagenome TaxID=412755 RepID=X0TLZ9_9ZZZZ
MNSRRTFLKVLGLGALGAASPFPFPSAVEGRESRPEIPPPLDLFKYHDYTWDHVLGPLPDAEALIHDLGEFERCWRKGVICNPEERKVYIPKDFHDGKTLWIWYQGCKTRLEETKTFIRRWNLVKELQLGFSVESEELWMALFSNPNLFELARQWKED